MTTRTPANRGLPRALAPVARVATALALLAGALSTGLSGAGAQSGDSFTYDEDGVEWSVEWDGDVWEESTTGQSDLGLQANATVASFLTVTGVTEDPAECIELVVPTFEDGANALDSEVIEDADGEPVEDDTADYAYQARSMTVEINGDEAPFFAYHACYQLAGDALLWVVAGGVEDAGDDTDDIVALFDGITVEGEQYDLGLADRLGQGGGDDNASPSARGSRGDDEEDASPSARSSRDDDEEDASPSARSSRDDEDEEPSPSERGSGGGGGDDEDASPSARGTDDEEDGGSSGTGADEDAGTYTAPTFGYSVSWDAGDWSVENELAAPDYTGDRDFLELAATDGAGFLYLEGGDDAWSDPDDCVATLFDELELDPADGQVVEDEDGEPFEVSGDDRSAAAYLFEVELTGGGTQDQIVLVECRADEESGVIVGLTGVAADDPDYVANVYPRFADILDTLDFGGETGSDATPVAQDDEDASPSARATDDGDSGDTGVDGNQWVAPTFDFSLEWDEDTFEVTNEVLEDEYDELELTSDLLVVTVTGFVLDDGPDGCLDHFLGIYDDRGEGDAEVATQRGSGDERLFVSEDGTQVEAYVDWTLDGDEMRSYFLCASLGGDDLIGLDFTGTPDDIESDDAQDLIDDILAGIAL